ncbi:MAG: hypothetical protein JSW08_03325 [archaeon]|nr:MAG: hypothetical protein JSW08_03325 [archaeon]
MIDGHYHIKFLDKSKEMLNPEELIDVRKQTRDLKCIRGNFLDYIIEMELIINILIENFMLHKKSNLRNVFRNNILNNRGVSLGQRIELLCEIIKEKKGIKELELKQLKKHLTSLRDERNRWAHGVIYFKQEKNGRDIKFQSYLNYLDSQGKEKEIILTNSYFEGIDLKLKAAQKFLVKVLVKRKFLSKDFLFKK